MGTGKTTVGKLLANKLNQQFIEMDEEIEAREKRKIVDIFKENSESYFRQLEKNLLKELAKKENLVVSCGGGLVCDQENLELLKNTGKVFSLEASVNNIYKRIKEHKHRPLLNVDEPLKKIEELLNKRKIYYNQAHYLINTDPLKPAEVVEKIISFLK